MEGFDVLFGDKGWIGNHSVNEFGVRFHEGNQTPMAPLWDTSVEATEVAEAEGSMSCVLDHWMEKKR